MLRDLFGPSQNEVWSQLSRELGAEFEEEGFFKRGMVRVRHGDWEITLDTYAVHAGNAHSVYTRIRAPFVNRDGFRFRIYRKSVFSGLGKLLGMQDIEVGEQFFDDDFVIQGSPETLVRRLLQNGPIRDLIRRQPDLHLEIKDDEGWFGDKFPEGVDELYFQTRGVVKEKSRLRELFDLFSLTLDELCEMGSAYRTSPGVRLK